MADWPLIGRERILAHLRALTEDASCRGVVLAAPAGVGKTRLATEVLRSAGQAGMRTLVANGSAAAAEVPLGAMASTLSAFGGMRNGPAEDAGTFLQDAVTHLIDQAGTDRVFLLIDDAHLLDQASAALVHQVAQRGGVFLLITLRTREHPPDAITALWKDALLERIELPELEAADIERLLATALGGPLDGGTLAELVARTKGNLLFLREIVTAARDDGSLRFEHDLWRLVSDSALPEVLVEVVEARLARLRPPEKRLLQLLAIGEPLGTRELEALSSYEVAEGLEDSGLIISINDGQRLELRLAHPVYGEALRSRLSGLQSRRLARALAEVSESTGLRRRDDVLRVGVWRLAAGGGRPQHLLAAALTARWRHDLTLAHRLASAAVNAGAGLEAELLTAQLLVRLGRLSEADELYTRLSRSADPRYRVRATLARVDLAQAADRPQEMRARLAEIDTPADPDLRAAVAARQCTATLALEGPRAALAMPVPDLDPNQGDAAFALYSTRATCLARMGRSDLAEQELARVTDTAPDSARLGWWRIPHSSSVAQQQVQAGRLKESIDRLREQYAQAVAVGSAELQMAIAHSLGRHYVDAGRPRTAAKFVNEALAISERLGYDVLRYESLRALALTDALARRPDRARESLAIVRSAKHDLPHYRGALGEATAWTAAAAGDLEAAAAEFQHTAAVCEDIGDLVHAAGALHGLVRLDRAHLAAEGLARLRPAMDGPWTELYLRHAHGLARANGPDLEATAAEFDRLGASLLAAETYADAARMYQHAGDPRQATATRNLAATVAQQCEGAQTPALDCLQDRKPLTPAELETAHLAAAGQSNKAIAATLQLSVRTVETRLQYAYAKLGISRRSDLAHVLPPEQ